MNVVDALLYRKLKKGDQYEKLIPKFENVVKKFDKPSDNSNTFDTLEYMAQWSKKYSWQFSKVAPLLKGKTLAETCRNIYNFLYNHFQYKLDGEAQNLYSPSAAWHYREKGFDCKTFSMLAQMLLDNLKIDCSFRQVQQSTPFWSHVYVVVPEGNKLHIIDATTHNNKEVFYTKKYDKKMMYHRGLASPLQFTGLGCACQGKPIARTGLGNPMVLQNTVNNFHKFLTQLERNGVNRNVTNTMLAIVKQNIENGIDPNLSEVFQRAIAMNTPTGLGRVHGLGLDLGTTATAVTGVFSGDTQSIKTLVSSIIPTNFLNSTFGAVFANGFDLSCWGASLTPQKAKVNIEKQYVPTFNYWLNRIQTATNTNDLQAAVNQFIRDAYAINKYQFEIKPSEANWSACARKAIKMYQDFVKPLKVKADAIVSDLVSKGATVETKRISPIVFMMPKSITGYDGGENATWKAPQNSFVDYPFLNLSKVVFTPINSGDTISIGGGNTSGGTTSGGNVATPPKPDSNKGLSLTNVALVGGGIAAALFLVKPKTDVTKSKPKTKTKK
ncbi:hypothetical protein [Flavobacterium capsici]|uniref:Uncharacterized protein n=1 Tax=Flavobacterium capsici TaxID=3075618 RepID=A0AA96F0S7_9FLAO|nr:MULTISPECIES: hypothetical protein [unclassified Flavobacterium]WNM19271.1 hypothetical protein RN608_00980 [Flavobacterium sp. PMR2A8]WNM20660.1 hypothetical protein RN605_08150 [Flavobacterium sp. PMTSA4]